MRGYPKSIVSPVEHSLDLDGARAFTARLVRDGLLSPSHPQLCLNSREGSADPLYEGAGKAIHPEGEFCVWNPLFEESPFAPLVRSAPWTIGRVRLMYLEPRKSYSIHRDGSQRIHYAIETNDQACLLVEMDRLRMWRVHIPADGRGYKVNTTLPHTALNGGIEPRIHLLINLR